MSVEMKKLSYEEYFELPEMRQRYEIIDGELIMSPSPTPYHQWISDNLVLLLKPFVQSRKLGVVISAPVDVLIHQAPLRIRQPDLLFLSAKRSGITSGPELRGMQLLKIAPDLVVEILSPSNTRRQIAEKLEDYQRIGVKECWMISPEAHTVEVLRLSPETVKTVEILGIGSVVRSEVIEGIEILVADIFA